MNRITAYIERDPEPSLYVGIVPGIPGAHTQAESLDELQVNLKEVLELCLEEMDPEAKRKPRFLPTPGWKSYQHSSPPRKSFSSSLDKRDFK